MEAENSAYPTISVVIPVKNEALKIKACLDGILSQTIPVMEIIVIDSGSTDGTVEILKSYPAVKLIEIPPSDFNHGMTRNLGVEHAAGEFILMTVGDARPFNKCWIEEMLKGFTDEDVAGVCGQQVVPHETDKNPIEWFRPISEPRIMRYQFSEKQFNEMNPAEKKQVCGWDDVTAMYRRNILLRIPYRRVSYAEDILWCKDVILSGYAVSYNYLARVYHYHNESTEFTYKRTFTVLFYQYLAFGYVPQLAKMGLRRRFSILKRLLFNSQIDWKAKLFWMRYNFGNWAALRNAVEDFIRMQKLGDEHLDQYHQKVCGHAPVPVKSTI